MSRARKFWSRMSRILIREGAAPRVYCFFFKAVVQAVLFFGAENWVVTPHIGKALGGFQTQVARRLTLGPAVCKRGNLVLWFAPVARVHPRTADHRKMPFYG